MTAISRDHAHCVKLLGLAPALLVLAGCSPGLKPVIPVPVTTVIAKVQEAPTGGGLDYRRDDFFEDDASIGLGSAWLTSSDGKKAKLFFFGIEEIKPSGGKPKEVLNFVAKKDASIDAGITNIFGVAITDSNAVNIIVTRRSMGTNISPAQLSKWAEAAAPYLPSDDVYVAFASKITENIITTDEFTSSTWKGNTAVHAIKILDTTYGSSGQLKLADSVIWVGLVGCRWTRNGPNGKPAITELAPAEFRNLFTSFGFK